MLTTDEKAIKMTDASKDDQEETVQSVTKTSQNCQSLNSSFLPGTRPMDLDCKVDDHGFRVHKRDCLLLPRREAYY